MILKQTKQLSNIYTFFILTLAVPLVGLFCFAVFIDHRFFLFLNIGLIIMIIYMIPLRNRLSRKHSESQLRMQDFEEKINLIEAEIQQEKIAIDAFKNKIVDYAKLKDLTERLSMSLTIEDTSKTLSEEVNALYGEKDTTIILYLFHSKTGELGISSSQKGQMRVNLKSKKGDEFDQWVVKAMQPLLIEDTKSDYRFDIDKITTENMRPIRSLISVPLMIGSKALGILRIDSPVEKHFGTEDLRFLRTIGDLSAVAIENAQLYGRVQKLAIRDSLTNLYLRRYLMERIPEEVARHVGGKASLSFMMVDLDYFKKYNDKFGHIAGDIVLKTVALILTDVFHRPGDLICRYGGEEFAVLLPNCTKQKVMELAETFRAKVEKEVITLRREKTHVTVSIGVATFPKDAQTKEGLIHKADQALYQAKEKGRNRIASA